MDISRINDHEFKWSISIEEFKMMVKSLKLSVPHVGPHEYDTRLGVPYEHGLKMIEEFEEFMKKEGIEV